MNDQDFKNLFKSVDHGQPTEFELAKWKRSIRGNIRERKPSEWIRLAAACVVGFLIGAATVKGLGHQNKSEQIIADNDATIEAISVNIQ
jgi:hypothetical protein